MILIIFTLLVMVIYLFLEPGNRDKLPLLVITFGLVLILVGLYNILIYMFPSLFNLVWSVNYQTMIFWPKLAISSGLIIIIWMAYVMTKSHHKH